MPEIIMGFAVRRSQLGRFRPHLTFIREYIRRAPIATISLGAHDNGATVYRYRITEEVTGLASAAVSLAVSVHV